MKRLIPGLAAVLLSAPLAAAEPAFSWSPSDLSTPDGVVRTHERIVVVAEDYCREHLEGTRNLSVFRACAAAVEDEIVGSIGNHILAVYSRTGVLETPRVATR